MTDKAFDDKLDKLHKQATTPKTPKTKKETNMTNIKDNQTVKTALTVFITLAGVVLLAGAFFLGMNYQKGVQSEIQGQVKSVVSAIKVEPSKQ